MIASFALCLIILNQSQNQQQMPQLWRSIAKTEVLVLTSEWQSESDSINKRIHFLKIDSTASRATKLAKIVNEARSSRDTHTNGIFYVRIMNQFDPEIIKSSGESKLITAISNSLGIADTAFIHEMYKFQYLGPNRLDCGAVGLKLVKQFPRDLDLQRAFLRDCAEGYAPLQDRYYAKKLHADWKGKMSDWEYYDLGAGINYTIVQLSNSPSNISDAKTFLTHAIKHAPTAAKRNFKSMMLDHLKKQYPDK